MHPLAHAILISWRRNRDYALRLVADVPAHDMTAQPVGTADPARIMNHPAWILGHLALYAGVSERLIRSEPFPDPMDDRFGPRSSPSVDPSLYPRDLVDRFREAHDAAGAALESASDAALARSTPLERWRSLHPTVGDMLVTLMVKHESGHLGQLSAWRRARGLPPVAQ